MRPPNNGVLNSYGEMKKVVKDPGNDLIHIDGCNKGCMFFFKKTKTSIHTSVKGIRDGRGKDSNKGIEVHYHM